MNDRWYKVNNESEVLSPAILIYPDRISMNIDTMIEMAGDVNRLIPHVKTHKLREILKLQLDKGINKFKTATLVEAELAAASGAVQVIVAYPLVGPAIEKFISLIQKYPAVSFSTLVDDESIVDSYNVIANKYQVRIPLFVDINCGMNRTGIKPGDKAKSLYKKINIMPWVDVKGLHVYDGHRREPDLKVRKKLCDLDFQPVQKLIDELTEAGLKPEQVVCGGTPTFPVHADISSRYVSPGTCILWDFGYSSKFRDLKFLHSAMIVTRVISKQENNMVCLDLGHKGIASEMAPLRIFFPEIPEYSMIIHSEEHMVIQLPGDTHASIKIGQVFYGIPMHICPTMALYNEVYVVSNQMVVNQWRVNARGRLEIV